MGTFFFTSIKRFRDELDQCKSEGYLNYGDAAYDAFEKILNEIHKLENKDE
jgi:hypothetical protein